jgi:hypothetical protein
MKEVDNLKLSVDGVCLHLRPTMWVQALFGFAIGNMFFIYFIFQMHNCLQISVEVELFV